MREMHGRVSFSAGAKAQVHAPQSSWNVQELKEAAQQTYLLSYPLFSLSSFSLSLSIVLSLSLTLSSYVE